MPICIRVTTHSKSCSPAPEVLVEQTGQSPAPHHAVEVRLEEEVVSWVFYALKEKPEPALFQPLRQKIVLPVGELLTVRSEHGIAKRSSPAIRPQPFLPDHMHEIPPPLTLQRMILPNLNPNRKLTIHRHNYNPHRSDVPILRLRLHTETTLHQLHLEESVLDVTVHVVVGEGLVED